MVRNYIRKSNRAVWSATQMLSAMNAVKSKEMSLRKAVKEYGVPFKTLRRRCQGKLKLLAPEHAAVNKLGSKRTILSEEQEAELEKCIINMENSFYGLTIDDVRRLTYQFCERNQVLNPFNKEIQMAGRDFIASFLQ